MDSRWCPIPYFQQGQKVLQVEHGRVLGQGPLASIIPRPQSFGLFWWGAIEKDACASSHPNLDSLQAAILRSWARYPEDAVKKACESFRPRIEAVNKKKGGHIK